MSQDNTLLIAAGIVAFYIWRKNQGVGYVSPFHGSTTVPASMPGSVGAGVAQVAVGALTGFLQGIVKGANNSGTGYVQPTTPLYTSGAVQDSADNLGAGSNAWPNLPDYMPGEFGIA